MLQSLSEGSGVKLSRCWEPFDSSPTKEIANLYSPEVICLSETKNRKCFMNKVRMKLRYDKLFVMDPVGRSGGLAVMWKKELAVSKVLFTDFSIELQIEGTRDESKWWLI